VDATFKRLADRAKALAIAQELEVPVLFVECVASREEAIRRLNARTTQRSEEISAPTPEVYEMQRNEFKPLTEIPARNYMMVDIGRRREELLAKIEAALEGGLRTPKNAVC
jgi:predicted kinase